MSSEVNSFKVNSNEIISECLKKYRKGKLFFRADGPDTCARVLSHANFARSLCQS